MIATSPIDYIYEQKQSGFSGVFCPSTSAFRFFTRCWNP